MQIKAETCHGYWRPGETETRVLEAIPAKFHFNLEMKDIRTDTADGADRLIVGNNLAVWNRVKSIY